jgi:LuxR family transcriptional regulator, maltose regulon positive regulatory protein
VSLRASNQLLEVETSALRFGLQETRQFLEQEAHVRPLADDVALLHGKTEGRPAAIRIAASTSPPQDFGRYIRNLSGAQRTTGAYLAHMLDGLPANLGRFMLRTAILDRLSAPLCEAARELAIAPETVKSHVKQIFTKLGVETRAQAVSRAQSLGLLRTQPARSSNGNRFLLHVAQWAVAAASANRPAKSTNR